MKVKCGQLCACLFVVFGVMNWVEAGEPCQRWVAGSMSGGSVVLSTANLGTSRIVFGGLFTQNVPNQQPAHNLVVWNGLAFSRLVTIGGAEGTNGAVRALKSLTTGGPFGGTTLYIGGDFTVAGGLNANRVVRWTEPGNGTLPEWSAMGSGFNGPVYALEIHNNELYAGGSFTFSGINPMKGIARWNGTAWQAVSGGIDGVVYSLKSYNGSLYAGGDFPSASGVNTGGLARWNGSNWSQVGGSFSGDVLALEVWNGWLAIGGSFPGLTNAPNLTWWNGSAYGYVGGSGTNGVVASLKSDGDWLYIGGEFSSIGVGGVGLPAGRVIRYAVPMGWDILNGGVSGGGVYALGVLRNELHAGGFFSLVGSPAVASPAWGRYLITGTPWIVQQPLGQTINCNGNANISMQAATGYEASTYTWQHFGAPMTNGVTPHGSLVSGANTATLSITNAKAPDIGAYRCVVQNGSCGSVTSTAVTLRVNNCCPGDIAGGDLMINIDDLLAVINAWGWTGPTGGHPADVNGSGQVNIDDLLMVINHWGACV